MKPYMKAILGIIGFAVLIGGSALLYNRLSSDYRPDMPAPSSDALPAASPEAGSESPAETPVPAPDFSVQDAEGNMVSLSEQKGKPVVINFWASWCGFCKSEMPEFDKAYKDWSDSVTFMMINVTDGDRETFEKAASYIEDNGYTFPVYYDVNLEAASSYQAYSLPVTYFIDAEGNVVTGHLGAMDEKDLRGYLESLTANGEE